MSRAVWVLFKCQGIHTYTDYSGCYFKQSFDTTA